MGYNRVGSVVVLELHRLLGNLSVKLAFKDGHQNDFLYLIIPGNTLIYCCVSKVPNSSVKSRKMIGFPPSGSAFKNVKDP